MNIADKLLASFSEFGERIALSEDDKQVTYKALQEQSLKVAVYLMRRGFKKSCIAIEVADTADHIVCIAGIVLSGNYYVSVTPENKPFFSNENVLPVGQVINTELLQQLLQTELPPAAYVQPETAPDDNLCAYFTSGSTGKSKIVIHNHRTILTQTLHDIEADAITCEDRMDLVFSVSFSASLSCIFPSLLSGAGLYIFNLKENGLHQLAGFWECNAITFSTLSVSVFQGVCKVTPSLKHLSSLRYISVSAEPVKETTLDYFYRQFPAATVLNMAYATTETRTIADLEIVNDQPAIIAANLLGRPQEDKRVYILNEADEQQPPHITGEIVVASSVIAGGYYGQPEESMLSFKRCGDTIQYRTGDLGYVDASGNLYYTGRKKNEVKLNGIKINLTDIDDEVEKLADIVQAATVINSSDTGVPRLVCFYKTNNAGFNAAAIKTHIAAALPPSHIPQFYVPLDHLPYTHTGKLDRRSLEKFDSSSFIKNNGVSAADGTTANRYEQVITESFKKILQTGNIDGNSNFFDCGGESLTGLLCIAEIENRINLNVISYELIDHPTPVKLSAYLAQKENKESLIKVVEAASRCGTKKDFYLLNFPVSKEADALKQALHKKYNIVELFFDIQVKRSRSDINQVLTEQLVGIISRSTDAVVMGFSFNGYVAHQLACLLPQVSYCVLIDTLYYLKPGYFGIRKNKPKRSMPEMLMAIAREMINNKDYGILRSIFKKKYERWLKGSLANKSSKPVLKGIESFTAAISYKYAINNCIYFQASRTAFKVKDHGHCWKQHISGRFYFKNLVAEHKNIIQKHALKMAAYIDEVISKNNM